MLNLKFGLINAFLKKVGLGVLAQPWMGNRLIFYSLICMVIWASTGFYMMILYSAMIKIPRYYYEAAMLDGANQMSLFFKITLPMIWDVFIISALYWIILAMKAFEIIYAFTGQEINPKIWTLSVYIYIIGFGRISPIYRLGYASAIAVVLFILIMVFVLNFRKITRREAIEY
jgi:raffinose/stachyose/melibiose transport system permease protein